VALAVVDVLELVEIEPKHGPVDLQLQRALDVSAEFGLESISVEQAGEWIVIRQVLKALFEVPAVGHVSDDRLKSYEPPIDIDPVDPLLRPANRLEPLDGELEYRARPSPGHRETRSLPHVR